MSGATVVQIRVGPLLLLTPSVDAQTPPAPRRSDPSWRVRTPRRDLVDEALDGFLDLCSVRGHTRRYVGYGDSVVLGETNTPTKNQVE